MGQHPFIAGHPLDAAGDDHADHLFGYRAFRRPHTARGLAEAFGVVGHAELYLGHGVLAPDERRIGQRRFGQRLERQIGVDQQWQNGVGEGRGRDLDLPRVLQLAVQGDDLIDQTQMLIENKRLVFFAEPFPLLDQGS